MVRIILVNMQKFKVLAFLDLEIRRHKEGNESSRFDIYPLESTKIRKNYFVPESIFSGPKLYSPMHFPGFQAKKKTKKIRMLNFSRRLI